MIRQLKINWSSPRLESMRGTMNRSQVVGLLSDLLSPMITASTSTCNHHSHRHRTLFLFEPRTIRLHGSVRIVLRIRIRAYFLCNLQVYFYLFFIFDFESFSITNSLVVTGKTINFILFCLSSEHFRRKCFVVIYKKFPKVWRNSKYQNIFKTFQLSQSSFGKRFLDHQRSNSCDRSSSLRTVRSRRGSANTIAGPTRDGASLLVSDEPSCATCSIEKTRSLSISRQNLPCRTRLDSGLSQEPDESCSPPLWL